MGDDDEDDGENEDDDEEEEEDDHDGDAVGASSCSCVGLHVHRRTQTCESLESEEPRKSIPFCLLAVKEDDEDGEVDDAYHPACVVSVVEGHRSTIHGSEGGAEDGGGEEEHGVLVVEEVVAVAGYDPDQVVAFDLLRIGPPE